MELKPTSKPHRLVGLSLSLNLGQGGYFDSVRDPPFCQLESPLHHLLPVLLLLSVLAALKSLQACVAKGDEEVSVSWYWDVSDTVRNLGRRVEGIDDGTCNVGDEVDTGDYREEIRTERMGMPQKDRSVCIVNRRNAVSERCWRRWSLLCFCRSSGEVNAEYEV